VHRSEELAALELDRHDAAVESRRAALTTAGQRRQALERLKARQREAHRVKSARREAGILDEIALNGHIRRAS
jgi:flagellar export protein FliJ